MLLLVYLVNAGIVASILIWAFLADRSTSKWHQSSWLIILVASTFWFIAIPLSCVEILQRSLHRRKTLRGRSKPSQHFG